ncbi:Ser/Thr protein kinase RdoA (MazF antagonist) [Mycoplana sp. BE70]|uniref:phosphotransferase n=1 Tax=Mycoplana sp. BE70 TaxID=2817775 RepID=UPI0028566E89|nr:phosphotransferase [Mycoplana sp. BE70]MDR6758948.1 Ser/Thr protein kinase RdoA (MazF antagonist) [Mycoplana sp. BE70]
MQKRIVELNQQQYVLYRFRTKRTMEHFEQTIQRLDSAGIAVQSICARTSSFGEYLRHGHWIALSYLPGRHLSGKANRDGLVSLGQTMAKLNSLEGPPRRALFERKRPKLPHEAYIAGETQLTDKQRTWIRESMDRLRGLPATQLTHGDLFGKNIIQNDDQSVGLIDYELLAYDLSGIELAATLLRPFCRRVQKRRILMRAYLRSCSPQLRQTWNQYGRDLVFAAAARLALARQDRVRHVTRKNRLLRIGQWLPNRSVRDAATRQLEANIAIIRAARRNEAYYLNITRTIIDLALADPDTGPINLLRQCDLLFVKPL